MAGQLEAASAGCSGDQAELEAQAATIAELRGQLAATQLFHALSDLARLEEETGRVDAGGRALYVQNLIDCIAGSLAAPVSDATRAAARGGES